MLEGPRESQILVLVPFGPFPLSPNELSRAIGLIREIRQDYNDDLQGYVSVENMARCLPWHISNDYYEADVHFKLSTFDVLGMRSVAGQRSDESRSSAKIVATTELQALLAEKVDEEDLKKKVRDVFEALEMPKTTSSPGRGSRESERIADLRHEVEGVDAVVLLVDRAQPLHQHQKLIASLSTVLTGFELAISLVVALPSPLQDSFDGHRSTQLLLTEQLQQIYTGEGWEFVDLEDEKGIEIDDEEEQGVEGDTESRDELYGVQRIREALETHTWPGLTRKCDRRSRVQEKHVSQLEGSDEGTLQNAFDSLHLDLADTDTSEGVGAEPTKEDEELANAFLKEILAVHSASADEGIKYFNGPAATRDIQSMQKELKDFLDREDPTWTVSSDPPFKHSAAEDQEATWEVQEEETPSSAHLAFEDDFTDFVQGSRRNVFDEAAGDRPASTHELSHDLDDLALLQALEREQDTSHSSAYIDRAMDFESTLSVIFAQAERVRSIADHQKRREEAARIALALSRDFS